MSEFNSRVVKPFLVLICALIALGIFVFAYSRVLLAVPKYWSVSLAGLLAAEILGIGALLAAMRRVSSGQKALVGLLGIIVLAGGGVGFAAGMRPIEAHKEAITIAAKDLAFDPTEITVPADQAFELTFDNQDAGIPHNIAIASGAETLFTGEIFNGAASKVYEAPALAAGTYAFRCDVHPTMTGMMTAGEGGEEGGAEPTAVPSDGGEHGASSVTASGSAFDTDTLMVEPGAETHLTFQNDDAGIPHNVAIYVDDTGAENLFRGETITGVATTTYVFTIEEAGEYFFRCDIHPTTMVGTVMVE